MIRVVCSYPESRIVSNVKAALKRGLPVVEEGKDRGAISVVAGGPSLSLFKSGPVAVLNGAQAVVKNADLSICYDMHPNCARFFREPTAKQYLIGSRADPAVRKALRGQDVRIWHVLDAPEKNLGLSPLVGGGPSVGLKSLLLLYFMGYREFDLYGYDSCLVGGEHHAYKQDWHVEKEILTATVMGREFKCWPWMIAQAESFIEQARIMRGWGCKIKVHGDGMIAWADIFACPKLKAS